MKIARIKLSLVVLATLFGMAALTYAQTPPDFSKVEIKTTKIADNFYTLEGQGGTIGVLAGPDGVFLVDTQFAPLTGKIVAAVKQISPNPIRRAHTDGDTLVYFHGANVLMTGDFFRSIGYPNIDRVNGGSLNGMLEGLGLVIGLAGPNTKIIPGHGPTVDRAAVIAHRDMILGVRDHVAELVKQGKSPEDVLAAHPTSDFDAKVPMVTGSSDRFVGQLYAELKPAK